MFWDKTASKPLQIGRLGTSKPKSGPVFHENGLKISFGNHFQPVLAKTGAEWGQSWNFHAMENPDENLPDTHPNISEFIKSVIF